MTWEASFILKGTALTSLLILLMLHGLLIFRPCLATPEYTLPLSLSHGLTTPGSISEVRVGLQITVLTTVTNREQVERPLVVITQVYDPNGVIESIGIVNATVGANSSIKVGVPWTPQHPGNYKLKSFAISDLEHPMILANTVESDIEVSKASAFPYVRIDRLYVAPFNNPFDEIRNNTLMVGKPYSITTQFTRLKAFDPGFMLVLDIMIKDKEDRLVASSWYFGSLAIGKSASGGIYWTPTTPGNYDIQSVVLQEFTGTPISQMETVHITVIQ